MKGRQVSWGGPTGHETRRTGKKDAWRAFNDPPPPSPGGAGQPYTGGRGAGDGHGNAITGRLAVHLDGGQPTVRRGLHGPTPLGADTGFLAPLFLMCGTAQHHRTRIAAKHPRPDGRRRWQPFGGRAARHYSTAAMPWTGQTRYCPTGRCKLGTWDCPRALLVGLFGFANRSGTGPRWGICPFITGTASKGGRNRRRRSRHEGDCSPPLLRRADLSVSWPASSARAVPASRLASVHCVLALSIIPDSIGTRCHRRGSSYGFSVQYAVD